MRHSRIPVYEENIDRVLGIVHAKDLIVHWGSLDIDLTKVMRKPYFIPETKKLDDLLAEFRAMRIRTAIVIDEYGGTSGMVTIEDMVEEIIGEIGDETDETPNLMQVVGPGELLVSARLETDDLFGHFEMEPPKGNFSTVGGWILDRIGAIPKQGQTLTIPPFRLHIETADERSVKKIRIFHGEKALPDE